MIKALLTQNKKQNKKSLVSAGVVEYINNRIIQGWAINSSTASQELAIELNGVKSKFSVRRTERLDVAKQHGEQYKLSGFECSLPIEFATTLKNELINKVPVVFVLGDVRLSLLDTALAASSVQGHIDCFESFRIRGWALSDGKRPARLVLRIGQHVLTLKPVWQSRKDVAAAIGVDAEEKVGFTAEIPSSIWSLSGSASGDRVLTMYVEADGVMIGQPMAISSDIILKWVETACTQPDESQYLMLCAIEHLHHSNLADRVSLDAATKLSKFARQFGLQDYVHLTREVAPITSDWSTQALWNALRKLNAALVEGYSADDFWKAFVATKNDIAFEDVAKRFSDSVVANLCRLDIYHRLLELDDIDFDRWSAWNSAEDAWHLTIAIPSLLLEKRVDECTKTLYQLKRHLNENWINTECLAYASRKVISQFLAGQLDHKSTAEFIYAYLDVLNTFNADWHSRLYDHQLMAGALMLLNGFDRYKDYLRRDISRNLLRYYGLQPNFWEEVVRSDTRLEHSVWLQAKRSWQNIQDFLSMEGTIPSWTVLTSSLRYFDQLGNLDAKRFAREIIGPQMEAINADLNHPAYILLDFLLEENHEGLRYAAFPIVADSTLHKYHSGCGAALTDSLRELTQRTKDSRYTTHQTWGSQISELARLLHTDVMQGKVRAVEFIQMLVAGVKQGDFLAADLLSWLCASPALADLNVKSAQTTILNLLMAQQSATPFSAPIQSAISRLLPILPEPMAEDTRSMVASFGKRLILPQTKHNQLCLSSKSSAWPGDTLVVIYSCRKYLDSRIKSIRASWVQDLIAREIPYLILVGDGDDCINGDVLALDVSDLYEDLPQKTLKLVDWVYTHTDFQYLYKIDDDCYLDVNRFFENLSYRSHHYYGRVIKRAEGSMDRAWHQNKSQSEYARNTLDKSPEPSIYADGGGGYVLSRFAMHALCESAKSDAGQQLVSVSMMEDKLVGDLLALVGISPSDKEYQSYQRRRTFGAAVPVGMWENLFFPSQYTPTVMCHLDTEHDQAFVHARRRSAEIWPKKIWQTSGKVLLEWNDLTNQLELISQSERLQDVLAKPLYVVAVMRNEMIMLPHFLNHYRQLGVAGFLIVDNCSDDGTREYLLNQPDVALFSADTEYKHSHYGVAWQQALLGNFCVGKWVLLADADELLVYPEYEKKSLVDFLVEVEAEGADAVRIGMVDMYPFGDLAEADFTKEQPFTAAPWYDSEPLSPWRLGSGYYSNAVNYVSALRHRVDTLAEPNAFNSVKTAFVRYQPWMRFSKGLHDATGMKLAQQWAWFAHFKYHAGFKAKVDAEVLRGQHFDGAKEYQRYQAMINESVGNFSIEGTSARFTSSLDINLGLQKVIGYHCGGNFVNK